MRKPRDGEPTKYAKTNLRDVEDSAIQSGLSATQEARFPRGSWPPSRRA
jgi:hypothetical protein